MKSAIRIAAIVSATILAAPAFACDTPASVCFSDLDDGFALIDDGMPAAVFIDEGSDPAVDRVATAFTQDLARVSGSEADMIFQGGVDGLTGPLVIIGVVGQSPTVDDLAARGLIDVSGIEGEWEAFRISVVDAPFPGVDRALVIAGSDRRGAVFGAYDISEDMGVSPWHWFADVPPRQSEDVFITAGARQEQPGVRYRGIFINDEAPAMSTWAEKKFGGFNADMYEHVFELILRLKGNYIWPAMWSPKAFHLDDPRSRVIADEMGIVIGTSHHEPMTRNAAEWHREGRDNPDYGGSWNYVTNGENLRKYWREGIERMMSKDDGTPYESLVTIGMRGDGDEPMSEETAIGLLEQVVEDQREIIADVTGKPASETPQVWALYKEVQDYYDEGMRVPDDVILLFADDNWGQIRRLPTKDQDRAGGFGVYYHFDYVGVPRSYKWINVTQIAQVWQQMNLAYERGANSLWVVNVGDLKPMEYPIDFFLKMAWDPEAMTPEALAAFPAEWAARQFGPENAEEIGDLVTRYGNYASRRTPELMNETTWPIGQVVSNSELLRGEYGRYVDQWTKLREEMEMVKVAIPEDQQDAFFQLVEHPILAFGNLYEMYWGVAWNHLLSGSYDPRGNMFLGVAERAYAYDASLTERYHTINDGKWDGMMNQIHMNYVNWATPTQQQPPILVYTSHENAERMRNAKVVFAGDVPMPAGRMEMPASAYTRKTSAKGIEWTAIPDLGQSGAAMVALPQGRAPTTADDNVALEYDFTSNTAGDITVELTFSPTLDTYGDEGIRIGVVLGDGPVRELNMNLIPTPGAARTPEQQAWIDAVINSYHRMDVTFEDVPAGQQTLRIIRLDDNVVLERIALIRE